MGRRWPRPWGGWGWSRLYTAITRHIVLVMAALAICAITAALVKDRTDTQTWPPSGPISRHPQNRG